MGTAIQAIYRDLEYAKTLIKHRTINPENDVGDEESWTFIGDEGDPELVRRIAEWGPSGRRSADLKRSPVVAASTHESPALAVPFHKMPSRESSRTRM